VQNMTYRGKPTEPENQYDAFCALWFTYLHLRVWGLPEYDQLTLEHCRYFRKLVASGTDAVFAHVENCKRAVIAAGLGESVRDEWLCVVPGISQFDPVKGVPDAARAYMGRILDEMYPLLVRLDAARDIPPPAPDDLCIMSVAVDQYITTRTTIRRNIRAEKLHDYREKGVARNSPILVSQAELSRLFTRR